MFFYSFNYQHSQIQLIFEQFLLDAQKEKHLEIFLDLMNLTNNMARMSEYYDESKPNKVGYVTQFPMFPNLMYRVYF